MHPPFFPLFNSAVCGEDEAPFTVRGENVVGNFNCEKGGGEERHFSTSTSKIPNKTFWWYNLLLGNSHDYYSDSALFLH